MEQAMTLWVATALLGVVIALLIALLLRRPSANQSNDSALLQQQLVELRGQLERLNSEQQKVPLALAQDSQTQSKALNDVREQLGQLTEAAKRVEEVGRAVSEVQQLLKVPKLRGGLGETWLESLLQQVFPGATQYQMQYAFRSGDTVDAVLKVGRQLLPIDSKFPLESCQRMLAATGEEAERERKRFLRSFRQRVDEIADKYIRPAEGTFDFALMYIPAENVYYEAVVRIHSQDQDAEFIEYALTRKVIPVSPHSFYAYLAVILHGLRGLKVEERTREIQAAIVGLQQQFGQFQRSFDLIGKHLGNATKQYGESERQIDRVNLQLQSITGAEHTAEHTHEEPPLKLGD